MYPSAQMVIEQTRSWIQKVVIDLNLCPFAAHVFNQDDIQYDVIEHDDTKTILHHLIETFEHLNNNKNIETSFIIFSNHYRNFNDYLTLLDLSNLLLDDLSYSGIYQLASFHPDYCFDDCSNQDASNFSNRSPYPMLHILREDSIEKALENYNNAEDIPDNNIERLEKIGFEKMQDTLQQIVNSKGC